jgi:hypothetical protein
MCAAKAQVGFQSAMSDLKERQMAANGHPGTPQMEPKVKESRSAGTSRLLAGRRLLQCLPMESSGHVKSGFYVPWRGETINVEAEEAKTQETLCNAINCVSNHFQTRVSQCCDVNFVGDILICILVSVLTRTLCL